MPNQICGHCNKEVAKLYTDCMVPSSIRIIGNEVIIDEDTTGFYTVLGHSFVQEQLGNSLPQTESLYRFSDDKTVAIELIIDLLHNTKKVSKELVSWLWGQLWNNFK